MFGNMKEMMKQAQNMKSEMTKVKKELEKIEVQGSSSNESCIVTMTADMKTTKVEIEETLLSSDAYIIENAINVRIKERIKRHDEEKWGWNAFYASLWHYFKYGWFDEIRTDIQGCLSNCMNLIHIRNNILSIIQQILNGSEYSLSDVEKLESYYIEKHPNYIYGKFIS